MHCDAQLSAIKSLRPSTKRSLIKLFDSTILQTRTTNTSTNALPDKPFQLQLSFKLEQPQLANALPDKTVQLQRPFKLEQPQLANA